MKTLLYIKFLHIGHTSKKDIDKMNKYKKEHKYLVVHKKIDDRLYLHEFFNK